MKYWKSFFSIFLVCLCICLSACSKTYDIVKVDKDSDKKNNVEKNIKNEDESNQESNQESDEDILGSNYTDDNFIKYGEEFEILESNYSENRSQYKMKVNECRFTKEVGDVSPYDISYICVDDREKDIDKNGNLVGDFSFAIISASVTNIGEKKSEIDLSNFSICERNIDTQIMLDACLEVEYLTPTDNEGRHSNFYTLEPNESQNFDIWYIVPDSYINNEDIFISYGSSILKSRPEDIVYIKLNK